MSIKSTIIKQLQVQQSKQEDQHRKLPQTFLLMKHKVRTFYYSQEKYNYILLHISTTNIQYPITTKLKGKLVHGENQKKITVM